MSCPTCDKTMQSLGGGPEGTVYWCPYCGTIIVPGMACVGDEPAYSTPKLVERCRRFEKIVGSSTVPCPEEEWVRLGIAEAINRPEDRPK